MKESKQKDKEIRLQDDDMNENSTKARNADLEFCDKLLLACMAKRQKGS